MLKNFQLIAKDIDVQPMLDALAQNEHLWNLNTLRTTHPDSPHTQVDDIWIRFNTLTDDLQNTIDDKEMIWYPAAMTLPAAYYMYPLLGLVTGDRFGRCVITRMHPGTHIGSHKDMGAPVGYYQRFHLAIKNAEGAVFKCGDEEFTPNVGDLFIFDNSKDHEITNNSDIDRITMIIDIHTPEFEHIKSTLPVVVEQKVSPKNPINKEYGAGYTYQVESFEEQCYEFEPFVLQHWNELGLTKEDVPIDFDWLRFFEQDRLGKLHTVTVRKDGDLVGYHISFIGSHPHYKSTKHAMVDLYYMKPELRAGRVGMNLFKFAESELKKIGVKKIYTGCKVKFDHTRLFEYLGYELSDYQFIKILKD